ncbi:carboxypeptidase M32 [Niveibacterium sp. 24ML]|uniref:carboxypeptidase M32 n=1 Tax=Niveibacterium sp. 24ML TaxID=2985512 RepID=UPI00226E5A50|nr:carboxypeptidase M32 [Niveibacterium sp. 24ML]MCX9157686.1 carboxypeptidase M32 [Niveibacterium sp. 24ML]
MQPNSPAYNELLARSRSMHRLAHLGAIAYVDRATLMPPGGNEARAAAAAELDQIMHARSTDPAIAGLLQAAEQEPLSDVARADLREMAQAYRMATALPAELVQAKTLATARCEHAWRSQRPANDWAGFLPNLREVLRIAREEAARLSDALGLSPYDALIERFEPGMRSAEIARVFDPMRAWLPGLIAQIRERQAQTPVIAPAGPFPVEAQHRLVREMIELLGFDFDRGRMDESTHPFCGGVPEDVRMTTRYREDDFSVSLFGTIHETGHARYEQNLPREWLGQGIGVARSMGIHESQSLAFEMQLARSPGFLAQLAPRLVRHFGAQAAFEPQALTRWATQVAPGKIRVDADEATYPCHVLLRFDLERALIGGELAVEDLPAAWDEGMRDLLGLDTRGDYRDGCMQDVHWAEGLFGYFPCYTLGALYAAQWFATMRRDTPDLDARIAAGDYAPVFGWLDAKIWSQGSRWTTPELVQRASGEALNPAHFKRHLEARYLA